MSLFLETDRLLLREFTPHDAQLLWDLDSDPEVMRYIGPFRLDSLDEYRLRIAQYIEYYQQQRNIGFWAAIEKQTHAFLGWFCLRPALDYRLAPLSQFGPTDVEIGYRLRRVAWGRGLATEGAQALVRRAFQEPIWHRGVSAALVTNIASTRVMEKAGLHRLRDFPIPGYEPHLVTYAITRDHYLSISPNLTPPLTKGGQGG